MDLPQGTAILVEAHLAGDQQTPTMGNGETNHIRQYSNANEYLIQDWYGFSDFCDRLFLHNSLLSHATGTTILGELWPPNGPVCTFWIFLGISPMASILSPNTSRLEAYRLWWILCFYQGSPGATGYDRQTELLRHVSRATKSSCGAFCQGRSTDRVILGRTVETSNAHYVKYVICERLYLFGKLTNLAMTSC